MPEILKVIAWPLVALVIALVSFFSLKPEIVALLRRLKSITKSGLETHDPQLAPQPGPISTEADRFFKNFENPILLEREEGIRKDLDRNKLTGGEREKALVRVLAVHQVGIHFERVYNVIWASQLALLIHLSGRPLGESVEALRFFYDSAAERFPQMFSNYSFDQYVGFLEQSILIERRENTWVLLPLGREFLKYLVDTAKTAPLIG